MSRGIYGSRSSRDSDRQPRAIRQRPTDSRLLSASWKATLPHHSRWPDEYLACRLSRGIHSSRSARDSDPERRSDAPALRRICIRKLNHAEITGRHLETGNHPASIGDRVDRFLGCWDCLETVSARARSGRLSSTHHTGIL